MALALLLLTHCEGDGGGDDAGANVDSGPLSPDDVELGACFYPERDFGGTPHCLELTMFTTDVVSFAALRDAGAALGAEAASVRVFGAAAVTLFEAPFGQGTQVRLTQDTPSLEATFETADASFEVSDVNECAEPAACGEREMCTNALGGFSCTAREACLFTDADGTGESLCLGDTGGPFDLAPGHDRSLSSLRVEGVVIVTLHSGFGGTGESRTFTADAELAAAGFDDVARSVTVRSPGQNSLTPRARCMEGGTERPPSTGLVALERVYAVDFIATTGGAFSPLDPERLYMAEKTGTISFADPDSVQKTIALDLTEHTYDGLDAGVLTIAFSPSFATDGELYVVYNRTCADHPAGVNPVCPGAGGFVSRLARFTSEDGGLSFDPASEEVILDSYNPVDNHTFGAIVFGPDGMLYVASGDGGNGCAECQASGLDRTSLRGKILRLDVTSPVVGADCISNEIAHYCVPDDNPFYGNADGYAEEIWAWGLRNPWRIAFDEDGRLWAADVGQNEYEEIDLIEPGQSYGWAAVEGPECYLGPPAECASPTHRGPIAWYDHATGGNAITGGHVYRGSITQLQGAYVFADFVSHRVWALWEDGGPGRPVDPLVSTAPGYAAEALFTTDELIASEGTFVPTFLEDAAGELYIVVAGPEFGFNDAPGEIYRFVPPGGVGSGDFPATLSATGCFTQNPWTGAWTVPTQELLPYDINAPFWSDGASKTRYIAMPAPGPGSRGAIAMDGDLALPIGTILVKEFTLAGRRVETRFMIRHDDGNWFGYTYAWRADQRDADLLQAGADVTFGDVTWHYPSPAECMLCHGAAPGRALGPETRQLDRQTTYTRGRRGSELDTWSYLGLIPWIDAAGTELARFAMDEGSGALLHDSSGRFAAATIIGNAEWAPTTIDGRATTALTFDGATHAQTAVPAGAERTLAAWIRPTSSADVAYIESVIDSDVPGEYGTGFGVDAGFISVLLDDEFWQTGVPVALNAWQHVALTFDDNIATLYVNGLAAGAHPYAQGPVGLTPYLIGKSNANDLYFHGQIADVRVFDSVLGASDVARLESGEPFVREALPAFPSLSEPSSGTLELRARAWLHTNCAQCHRPGGNGQGGIDLRFDTSFDESGLCNVPAQYGRAGIDASIDARLVVPGSPEASVLYARIVQVDPNWRMPPISSLVADEEGAQLIAQFIESLDECP